MQQRRRRRLRRPPSGLRRLDQRLRRCPARLRLRLRARHRARLRLRRPARHHLSRRRRRPPCTTRIQYGDAWIHGGNHPDDFDVAQGSITWDGVCTDDGANSYALLSNGWQPHFEGAGACALSFRYEGCGGLYDNPVIPGGCADPGVLLDGSTYVVTCTSGGAADAFPIRTSKYVAYFTARHTDGKLCLGAATSSSATGPFQDLGQPLVHDATMGMIDATELEDASATPYLVWKADGNAVGKATPIYGQKLDTAGTALVGNRATLAARPVNEARCADPDDERGVDRPGALLGRAGAVGRDGDGPSRVAGGPRERPRRRAAPARRSRRLERRLAVGPRSAFERLAADAVNAAARRPTSAARKC